MIYSDEMEAIQRETGFDMNILFCGYLKQPICVDKGKNGYFIEGYCTKIKKRCLRFVDKRTEVCHECTKHTRQKKESHKRKDLNHIRLESYSGNEDKEVCRLGKRRRTICL